MILPNKLPIVRMEDYHTHYLGEIDDGRLFWGYETFVFTKPHADIINEDWRKFRKEYAILHTFERGGNYLTSKVYSSYTFDSSRIISDKLEEYVASLGGVKYKDIEVKLIETLIDGIIFGLIPNYETGSINLQPGAMISFQEPWDGEYYT